MTGIENITRAFERSEAEDRAALMPYFTLGYPTEVESIAIIKRIAESGADLIELGIPFSDPLADGPTIQRSTQVALDGGITVMGCLSMTARLRDMGVDQPLILMGYINPILAYGMERFVEHASGAGADGFIVPDLPVEEADAMQTACMEHQMALIHMLALTSGESRIQQVVGKSTGFVYLVSVKGVTGARRGISGPLEEFVDSVRIATNLPLAVGFGIGTPEQAKMIGRFADGVIVGSALINAVDESQDRVAAAGKFVNLLSRALRSG